MLAGVKRIGLLGGMSWESSAEYYRIVNEATRDRLGGLHSADCLLRSVDFTDIEVLQRSSRWEEAGAVLAAEAASLVAAGAELIVLCTNTMHKVADAIGAAVEVPFVHIAGCRSSTSPTRPRTPFAPAVCRPSACSQPVTRWTRTSMSAACATATA